MRSEPLAFGDYRALRVVAKGGMGVVYAAYHGTTGAEVAVKAVDTSRWLDPNARQRFLREARTLSEVRHPNVVRVFEAVLEHDPPFLVMELLEGETLQALLRRERRPSLDRAVAWFAPILSAVAAIHEAGVLHRDLKLTNVMLARDGDDVRPVVIDFGISKLARDDGDDPTLTHSEALLGTPRYLSPEQMLNAKAASPRSDQYALGVMLYECLSGARPFSGNSHYELMHAILHAPVEPPSAHAPELPAAIDAVIARAMNRDAGARFEDVRAFGRALLEFGAPETRARWHADFEAVDATEVDTRRCSKRAPARPSKRAWMLPAGAMLVLASSAAILLRGGLGRADEPFAMPRARALSPAAAAPARPAISTPLALEPAASTEPAPAARLAPSKKAPVKVRRRARPKPTEALPEEPGRDDVVDPFPAH